MAADISPMRQGQTDPPAHWSFKNKLGQSVPLPTGTTFALLIYDPKTNKRVTGAGSWININLPAGTADYQWDPKDSATVGKFLVMAQYTLPTGKIGYTDEVDWEIKPLFYQQ